MLNNIFNGKSKSNDENEKERTINFIELSEKKINKRMSQEEQEEYLADEGFENIEEFVKNNPSETTRLLKTLILQPYQKRFKEISFGRKADPLELFIINKHKELVTKLPEERIGDFLEDRGLDRIYDDKFYNNRDLVIKLAELLLCLYYSQRLDIVFLKQNNDSKDEIIKEALKILKTKGVNLTAEKISEKIKKDKEVK